VIKGPQHNIYFGADSGYSPDFKEIGEAFGPFDLTMLEIGAYGTYWPDIHMGPDNASNAHLDLKGDIMMGIHWGTFNLAPHAWYETCRAPGAIRQRQAYQAVSTRTGQTNRSSAIGYQLVEEVYELIGKPSSTLVSRVSNF
jgi:L-ascorbate metabolism protein UlaG (beta-lactamase superfamily)